MSKGTTRQSNIELLRILAAIFVVFLHYNNPLVGGGFSFVQNDSAGQFIMAFLEVISICAVNLFVLISGYFLRNVSERDLLKPVELVFQVVLFGLIFYVIKEVPKGEGFLLDNFLKYFISSYWFVFVYTALYLISPFINIVWNNLDAKGRKLLLAITLIIFSAYPVTLEYMSYLSGRSFSAISTVGAEGSQAGYTIVNFVLMYLLGCALRDFNGKYSKGRLLLFLAADIAALLGWTYFDMFLTGKDIFESVALNYDNPLVILEAVLIFMLFKDLKMGENKVINALARASFSVYLTHIGLLDYFGVETFAQNGPVVLFFHEIATAAIIYLVSYVIYRIYSFVVLPLFSYIGKSWNKGRKYTV